METVFLLVCVIAYIKFEGVIFLNTATSQQNITCEIRQVSGAYLFYRGERMSDKQAKTYCKSIFKNSETMNLQFSGLWAEVINELEKTRYMPQLEKSDDISYNGQVQSRPNQSKNGKVSDT